MTIIDAIEQVLRESGKPMSHIAIYRAIIDKNLYSFGAKDPVSIVRGKLRKHCFGIDFPSASPKKIFIVVNDKKEKSTLYYLPSDIAGNVVSLPAKPSTDLLVEEVIHIKHGEHLANIKYQLLSLLKNTDPSFFESLVVKLLLKMGYGWDQDKSGIVTGGKGDEGIDGVINEDKLGLEKIYIQAKRYSEKDVPPREVREFIGSVAMKGARKGVFFSTSGFTPSAIQQAQAAPNINITLIDGISLCDLFVQYEMGIALVENYSVWEIDRNFFDED